MALFAGGQRMSNATKGSERELFVRSFLSQVFHPMHQFDSGDIVDSHQVPSGQLDIVLPYPDVPWSFPMLADGPRLYLAEGVAVAIEVKSDVEKQWDQVLRSATALKKLERESKRDNLKKLSATREKYHADGGTPAENDPLIAMWTKQLAAIPEQYESKHIPFLVVGFRGWDTREAVRKHWDGSPVDGILVLDSLIWESNVPNRMTHQGWDALLAFIDVLGHQITNRAVYDPAINNYGFSAGLHPETIQRNDIPPKVEPTTGGQPDHCGAPSKTKRKKHSRKPAAAAIGQHPRLSYSQRDLDLTMGLIASAPGMTIGNYYKASDGMDFAKFKNVMARLRRLGVVKTKGTRRATTYRLK